MASSAHGKDEVCRTIRMNWTQLHWDMLQIEASYVYCNLKRVPDIMKSKSNNRSNLQTRFLHKLSYTDLFHISTLKYSTKLHNCSGPNLCTISRLWYLLHNTIYCIVFGISRHTLGISHPRYGTKVLNLSLFTRHFLPSPLTYRPFLGAFGKLRKATITSVTYACPSVRR